ncbi:hypothetical protein DdX_14003 [Ditylenchus destructor]|uniref:Odorant receptor n=1 Tax=Ditylenchus destructor TaxID=166010 RepID=A0AAD4MXL3_9BILA|nr:hypothetical protein DdX_14003 [Ditylenchus destructor]
MVCSSCVYIPDTSTWNLRRFFYMIFYLSILLQRWEFVFQDLESVESDINVVQIRLALNSDSKHSMEASNECIKMFIFCWQRTGVVKFLEQAVKCNFTDDKSKYLLTRKIEKIIRRCAKIMILLTVFGVARSITYTIDFAVKRGLGLFDPILGLHPFDFLYRFIGFYQQFLINCVVCYFVTSVQCLTIQLQEFNRELEQLLQCSSKESDFADRLMDSFSMHQTLAKKVLETDKIFRVFIFCMLASGVPMMVFGTITLVRRETLVSFLMALYDLIFCIAQLTAFTVVPAQLYAELHAVPSHIYWSPVIWRSFDPHLFQIARSFSENVKDLNVGLSFGGLVFIRKSSILMHKAICRNRASTFSQQITDRIVVYQAYNNEIANFALANGYFGGPKFSLERMSWIKPGFMWMMYRSGWATKPNQERVLAIYLGKESLQRFSSVPFQPPSIQTHNILTEKTGAKPCRHLTSSCSGILITIHKAENLKEELSKSASEVRR